MTQPQREPTTLHLRPVPALDGPYDDEIDRPSTASVVGSVALSLPPSRRAGTPLRLVPPAGGPPTAPQPSSPGSGPAPVSPATTWPSAMADSSAADPGSPATLGTLPDPLAWARRLSQILAEVLTGTRPPAQLAAVATLDVLALLERGAGRFGARLPGPRCAPVVRSVRLDQPRRGVAEACAVVDLGPRRRAIALRLEGRDGRWWCTALQVG